MIEISNTKECFVQLWLRLERTRPLLEERHKRFCVNNILREWFGMRAKELFIWDVCDQSGLEGWEELPPPAQFPKRHRELIKALVAVRLGISYWKVNLRALDCAYSVAFPTSTPLNVNKKTPSSSPIRGRT